jgi:hypothetical protein
MGCLAVVPIGISSVRAASPDPTSSPGPTGSLAQFGAPTATSSFGSGMTFVQPVRVDAPVVRAEILLSFPGSVGPLVQEVPAAAGTGDQTLRYAFTIGDQGHLLPNTKVTARWRLVLGDPTAAPVVGPEVAVTYADDRFTWRTDAGPIVRVHWYQGDDAFGARARSIGEAAVANAEALFGVTETEPIDFFVYADQQAFYDALGPGTRENVGGQADATIRTLFALITPAEINAAWVGIVIPHELTHLVFDTAVTNPYNFPPRWLNEGLAVYESQGYDDSDRQLVRSAAAAGTLIPLEGLGGQFPTSQDAFYLAYAESVSAIDFMIRHYGQDALVALVHEYPKGVSDDEAFTAALGVDVAGFDAAWFAELGVPMPTRIGPKADPAGPVPPGWANAEGSPAPASPGVTTGPAAPIPVAGGGSADDTVRLVGLLAIGSAVVAALALVVGRRRRDRRRGTGSIPAMVPMPGEVASLPPSAPTASPDATSGAPPASQPPDR